MNFELNDEQAQLQESVRRLLADHGSFAQRRAAVATGDGYQRSLWRHLAELGITALCVEEAHGGFGGGAVDRLPVLQACGHALLLEPVLSSSVLGATAVQLAGDSVAKTRLLEPAAVGKLLLAWAHDEADARHASHWVATQATHRAGQWTLTGRKSHVLHGETADHVIVSARIDGAPDSRNGVALFVVDAGAAGLQRRGYRLIDDMPAAELIMDGVPAAPLGDPYDAASAHAALQGTLNAGIAAVCADMLGAMELAFELAVDYLNTRQQFGRLIGQNQALRHKAAEMQVGLEISRSMAIAAAIAVDRPDAPESAADLLRAKLVIGRHARQLCQNAVQIHGGIGMTEEYAVGHALRRVHVLDQLFGDSATQAARLADARAARV